MVPYFMVMFCALSQVNLLENEEFAVRLDRDKNKTLLTFSGVSVVCEATKSIKFTTSGHCFCFAIYIS